VLPEGAKLMGNKDFGVDSGRYGGAFPRPFVRLSAIGDGWELYKQRWGVWMLTSLIVLVCYVPVLSLLSAPFGVRHIQGPGGFRMPVFPPGGTALQVALTMIVLGFFLGGMFRMACKQVRALPIGVEDLFRIVDVLPNLFLGSVIWGLLSFAASFCLVIPGLIVSGTLMFTVPLIVDGGLVGTEAIGQSWNALKGQWLAATVFHAVASMVASIGSLCCCVGILFTAPLYVLSIAVLYRDFFLLPGALPGAKPTPPFSEF
jgi:hypothetical protein